MEERNEMKWGWRWGSRMGTEAGVCEHCGFPLHVTHFPHVRNLVFPFLLFFLPLFFFLKKKAKTGSVNPQFLKRFIRTAQGLFNLA